MVGRRTACETFGEAGECLKCEIACQTSRLSHGELKRFRAVDEREWEIEVGDDDRDLRDGRGSSGQTSAGSERASSVRWCKNGSAAPGRTRRILRDAGMLTRLEWESTGQRQKRRRVE